LDTGWFGFVPYRREFIEDPEYRYFTQN